MAGKRSWFQWLVDAGLELAAGMAEAVVDTEPAGSPSRQAALQVGAAVNSAIFSRSQDRRSLRALMRFSAELGEHVDPSWGVDADALRAFLLHQVDRRLSTVQLQEAVGGLEQGLTRQEQGSSGEATLVALLAKGHLMLFDETYQRSNLIRAVELSRLLLDTATTGPEEEAANLSHAAVIHLVRYDFDGDVRDVDEAIRLGRQAVSLVSAGSPRTACLRTNLASSLGRRALLHPADDSDLDEAITVLREVVRESRRREDSENYAMSNSSLAVFRYQRFLRHEQRDDLDEAIVAAVNAADAHDDAHPNAPLVLNSLAVYLHERYHRFADFDDRKFAIACARTALRLAPEGSRFHGPAAYGLGASLLQRHVEGGPDAEASDLDEAAAIFQGMLDGNVVPILRVRAARGLAHARGYQGDLEGAMESYRQAVRELPRVAGVRLSPMSRLLNLSDTDGLARHAAHLALRLAESDPGQASRHLRAAVVLLEHGRGLMLSPALNAQGDLALLAKTRPDLAADYARLCADLATLAQGSTAAAGEFQQRLAEELDHLIVRIRKVQGFDRFLRPPEYEELAPAWRRGPVVLLNVSGRQCDALVLGLGEDPVVVPLPKLTEAELTTRTETFERASRTAGDGPQGEFDQVIAETLGWLWDSVVEPVVTEISERGWPQPGGGPKRLWLVPTGKLSLMPLHAAGHRADDGNPERGADLLDLAGVSYSPTVRALAASADRPAVPWRRDRTIGVAVSKAAGQELLPAVTREVRTAAASPFEGSDATVQRVRDALRTTPDVCLHLACHAMADPYDPAKAVLLLHDGELSFLDIAALRVEEGRLAYLAACETAVAGGWARNSDEPLSLAAAFQLAGFTHTVGTLWPIRDPVSAWAAREFYRHLSDPAGEPSVALHRTVLAMRRRYRGRPTAWASLIHLGP